MAIKSMHLRLSTGLHKQVVRTAKKWGCSVNQTTQMLLSLGLATTTEGLVKVKDSPAGIRKTEAGK